MVYEDYIIIAALLIKTLERPSLRDLEERLKDIFPEVSDFITVHYTLKNTAYSKTNNESTQSRGVLLSYSGWNRIR